MNRHIGQFKLEMMYLSMLYEFA